MIINTGCRTDIPAFYSKWLMNRIREGYVLVRNPYNPSQVTKYSLSPNVLSPFYSFNKYYIIKISKQLKYLLFLHKTNLFILICNPAFLLCFCYFISTFIIIN